jgi:general secretion pathway protein A
MRIAGAQSEVFNAAAIRALYRKSRGIPRLINVVADRALLAAYTQDTRLVDGRLVGLAAAEVFGAPRTASRWWPWAAAAVGLAAFALATTNLWSTQEQRVASAAVSDGEHGSAPTQRASLGREPSLAGAVAPSASADAPAVSVTDSETAAQPHLTLAALAADPSFTMDRDHAVGELLTRWGAHYDPSAGSACDQAARQGLHCLSQERGSLSELRRLNWPALLTLVDEHGSQHDVVISHLDYESADVVANGKTFELPLAELTYCWYGDHLLLWRPGFAPAKDLTPGMRDPGVLWLRDTLARLGKDDPANRASPLFDDGLEARVREYQRERLLSVDGIVGARTQVALIADLNVPGTPLLAEGP